MSEVIIDMEDDSSGKFNKTITVNSEEEYDFLKRMQEAYEIGKDKEWNFKKEKFHIAFTTRVTETKHYLSLSLGNYHLHGTNVAKTI